MPEFYPFREPMCHPGLQRPDLDEPGRGLLGEQAAGLGEGRELGVVDRVRALARHDAGRALVELQPDRAGHVLVDVPDVGLEVGPQRLPPQARVDEVGPLLVEPRLELVLVDRPGQALQLAVGLQQDRRRRHLVDVAHLRPTIRSSMWSTIPTPWRMPISAARSISSTRPRRSPFSATGTPASNSTVHDLRLVGRLLRARHELEDVVLGRVGEVLDPAALRAAAPEVVVDRVRRRLGAALDRDPVLARVRDLLVAAHRPRAHRRDHLQLGRERGDGALDPHLVVALAGAAVGDRVAARSCARTRPRAWRSAAGRAR